MIKTLLLIALINSAAYAADVSTKIFPFGGAVPSTGQTIRYSTATGDDSFYNPLRPQPKLTLISVGISSITYDGSTGLYWITNTGTDAAIGGNYTWENAISACEGLIYQGFSDWRLPNIKEISTASTKYHAPTGMAIDTIYFNNPLGNLWSSTTFVNNTTQAFTLSRTVGNPGVLGKTSSAKIRCVRGGI